MKLNRLIVMICIFFTSGAAYAFTCGHTHFMPRSQAVNLARAMPEDDDAIRYSFWVTPEYTRSFRPGTIANYLFGCNCGTLIFSGSRVADRGVRDVLADYFGLPSDFKSKVSFRPLIQNLLVDFGCRVNLDWLREGLYFYSYAPLVHTRWNLCMNEIVLDPGVNFSPAGYFSGGNLRLERDQLVKDVKTAFQGNSTFGDMQDPMRFGKICGTRIATEVATIHAELGCNFCDEETCKVGASIFIDAPTGTRTKAEYLFEPIVGNGHHWELGFGLHGSKEFWGGECGSSRLWFFARANVSHLFESQQRRSFDLKKDGSCRRGSRYMLLTSMDTLRNDILQIPQDVAPEYQYNGHLFPAINKTTLDCRINIIIQADILLGIACKRDNWELDFGYNLWARSRERLQCRQELPKETFAIKGDAQLYGFLDLLATPEAWAPIPLNTTQHEATIYAGQGDRNADFSNQNADNAEDAYERVNQASLIALTGTDGTSLGLGTPDVSGSNPPIFLRNCDIDEESGLAPRAVSSKIFLSCQRTFQGDEQWDRFLGAGVEVEFGHSCRALTQFGIWLRAGISY